MATVIKVVYEDGVLKPEGPVELEEKRHYVARIEPAAEQALPQEDDDPTGWKAAERFIGMWTDAPADDIAERHDDYLYGRTE